MIPAERPIAVMDSGCGGLSVLQALRRLMPGEDYLYFGDNAHAPYGEKSHDTVRKLTFAVVEGFLAQNAKAVVVACNTATAVAIAALREAYPTLPIIGLEPAIKPAVLKHPGETVLVMGTPLTLREGKFAHLMEKYQEQADIRPLPCPGLAECIEQGHLDDEPLGSLLDDLLADAPQSPAAVVLGCTHYPLIRPVLEKRFPAGTPLYDGSDGAARETKRRLQEADLLRSADDKGSLSVSASGDAERISRLAEILGIKAP